MSGRYGMDQFNSFLLFVTVILALASWVFNMEKLLHASYVPLLFCLIRILSKDIPRRRMENEKIMALVKDIRLWGIGKKQRMLDMKTHKYFSCPGCRTTVRVPKGKGRVVITCPICHTNFEKDT